MIKMRFDFENRKLTDLDYVNKALSAMRLSDVNVEESDGYLEVTTAYDFETHQPTEITYNYGFDYLVLACEDTEGDEMYTWQVTTVAFPKGKVPDTNAFHEKWCSEHPDRAMRSLIHYTFEENENADAYVVLHFRKIGE